MSAENELTKVAAENSGPLLKYGGMVLGGFAAAVSSVGGWLFKRVVEKHDQEIKGIKDGIAAVSVKVDTKLDTETYETNRREQRENVVKLHEKIDAQTGELRGQMERGFSEIRTILLDQRSRHRSSD